MVDTLDPANVRAVFKAYDVRGTVPDQVDEELARATGSAFVRVVGATTVVVGHDMRPSSPGMAGAFAAGDPVDLLDENGHAVARGLVNFDAAEIPGLLGRSTRDLAAELGPAYEREIVHRDDLVLLRHVP